MIFVEFYSSLLVSTSSILLEQILRERQTAAQIMISIQTTADEKVKSIQTAPCEKDKLYTNSINDAAYNLLRNNTCTK